MSTARAPELAGTPASTPAVPGVGRVRRRRAEAPDVWTLEIESDGAPFAAFAPGQFNMLTAFGVGEAAISMSGNPAAGERLVHTIRAVGPVSTALTRLRSGAPVGVRGPFGRGWPVREATGRDVVVVAGGLGLAPLRPVLHHLIAERDSYGNVALLYGTRSPDDILFRNGIRAWRRRRDMDVEVTVDHARADWRGHVGVVSTLIPHATFDPLNTIALICGPEVMMRFTVAALEAAGMAQDRMYVSLERNMKCAVGHCGHCQLGSTFICRDGPVFRYDQVRDLLGVREL